MTAKKCPSRVRYEKQNPTVSLRLSKEERDYLDQVRAKRGQSIKDVLMIGAGMAEQYDEELEARIAARRIIYLGRCYYCGKPFAYDLDDPECMKWLSNLVLGVTINKASYHPQCFPYRR